MLPSFEMAAREGKGLCGARKKTKSTVVTNMLSVTLCNGEGSGGV